MKGKCLGVLLIAGLSGILLASCGGGGDNTATDSTGIMHTDSNVMISDTGTVRDTAPAAEQPPGAINTGEDSARYGTGTEDSSRNRHRH